MTQADQRHLIKHRLAQAHRIPAAEIASGRNKTLNSAVTRIFYLANPRGPTSAAELAEARRRGVGFHACYAIAAGRKSLAEADPPKSSPSELKSRLHALVTSSLDSGIFLDEITRVFSDTLASFHELKSS